MEYRPYKPTKKLKQGFTCSGCEDAEPTSILERHMVNRSVETHEHLQLLYMLSIEKNLKILVEIGTRHADGSTIPMLCAAAELGGHLYSIDKNTPEEKIDGEYVPENAEIAKANVKKSGMEKYWTYLEQDSLKVDWKDPIDHLYIDGLHMFDQVSKELKKYEPFIRPGGIITLHDIVFFPEVLSAIQEYIKDREDLRLYKFFHGYGLGVIIKNNLVQKNND